MGTVDLRDLGATPEHDGTQQCLEVLAAGVDAATLALLACESEANRAALSVAVVAFNAARVDATSAAYEAWLDGAA